MADNFAFPYYIDSAIDTELDGTNNGTSAATPKKFWRSITQGSFNYRMGQALLLRPGRFYDVRDIGGGMGAIARGHITIKPWDNGESGNPTLDGRNWISPITQLNQSRFTPEGDADGGGHIWSIIVGTQQPVIRVFAASQNNGVLLHQRTVGEGLGRAADAIDTQQSPATVAKVKQFLNEQDCWFGSGSGLQYRLFMWTPSALQDPTMYYQGLSFLQHGGGTYGFDVGVFITSSATDFAQDITVQDINVLGATGSSFSVNTTDTNRPITNIRIERCNGLLVVRSGMTVRSAVTAPGIASGAVAISDVQVRSCTMDNTLSSKEEERSRAYSHFTVADTFTIFDRVDNVVMEDCVAINPRHTGFAMGNYSASSTWTRRSGFRRGKAIGTEGNTYARAYAISMTEDTCFVDQMTADGMNVASQVIGSVLLTNPVHINQRAPLRMADLPDPANNHLSIYSNIVDRGTANIGNERYIYSYPINVRIQNASFGPLPSPNSPMIKVAAYGGIPAGSTGLSPAQFPSGTVSISNSLLLDTHPARKGKPVITTEVDANVTLGDIAFDTNAVFKGGEEPTVAYRGSTTTINAAPGFAANITADPKVDRNLRPTRGSPLTAKGKVLGRVMRDATGRERPARSTIGAFEDFMIYTRQPR